MKIFSLIFVFLFSFSCKTETKNDIKVMSEQETERIEKKPEIDFNKTKLKAEEALQFCKSKNFNTDFCILIDMSLHSGIKRFFVWNFKPILFPKNIWWATAVVPINGALMVLRIILNSAMKTEAIFHHWENTNCREEGTAIGE